MYKPDEYLFTLLTELQDDGWFRVSLFLDEEGGYIPAPSYLKLAKKRSSLAHFNERDVPEGVYRFVPANLGLGYNHVNNQLGVVVKYDTNKIYLMQQAPQKGYYMQLDINLGVPITTLQLDSNATILMNASESDNLVKDLRWVTGQKLDAPDNRELTEDELFDLWHVLDNPDWQEIAQELYDVYSSFLPFNYNQQRLEEVMSNDV